MRIYLENGIVTAQAQTVSEAAMLLSYKKNGEIEGKRHHYNRGWKKSCPKCPKVFQGKRALGVHTALFHEGRHWRIKEKNTPVEVIGFNQPTQ